MSTRFPSLSLAVLALAAVSFAAPAYADSVASCRSDMVTLSDGRTVSTIDLRATSIAMQLRQRGYDVDSVEDWGGCVKAFINDPNGHSHMQFFDADSLEPLSP